MPNDNPNFATSALQHKLKIASDKKTNTELLNTPIASVSKAL